MSQTQRPQTKIWCGVWNTAQKVLNCVDTLLDSNFSDFKLEKIIKIRNK